MTVTGNVRSGADDELLLCGRLCQHRGLSLTPHRSQAGEEMVADALGGLEHPQSHNISDGDICSSGQGGDRTHPGIILIMICPIAEPDHPGHFLYWTEHLLHHVCLLLLPGAQ